MAGTTSRPRGSSGYVEPSALAAAQAAMSRWVRISANRRSAGMTCLRQWGNSHQPEWPELSFQELLRLAFKDRFIDSNNHPILRRLRGEM